MILKSLKKKVKFLILIIQQQKPELTTIENKWPNVSGLVIKTDHNTKITEIKTKLTGHDHDKYITTPEFNTLATNVLMQGQHKQIQSRKQFLITLYQILIVKSQQMKQKMNLLKMN